MNMSETSQHSSESDGKSHRPRGSRKRQVHNEVERRRKDKINGWISKIAELLPGKELHKPSKINILEQTVDYIKNLVSERDKLLSENCSEVQAEEIKKLKRDLQILSEQNAVYVKLLEQSNISLRTLPKKSLKYSNKFVRKNGVLTVKNTESDVSAYVDSAIQVDKNTSVNTPCSVSVNSSTLSTCEKLKVSTSAISKGSKAISKTTSNASKPLRILSAVTTSSVIQSCSPITCFQSSAPVNTALMTQTVQQSNSISQENVIPVVSWNDPTKNSTSAHAGGVTTVLSQLPVMSTTLGSSFSNVYNKNVPTFIIPAGSNILQSFPTEKPSNTISIICPSTLPILVPQQVLNMPSVARNVGLPPTIICPGPVDNSSAQVEKCNLGSALLTINPSSIVPISSSLSANTRIILPSQSTLVGNGCANVNLTHNIISPLLTAATQSEDLIVPLVQKLPVSSPNKNAKDSLCENNSLKTDKNESKAVENALTKNKNLPNATSLPLNTCIESKSSTRTSEQITKKQISQGRLSLCSNTPPSLQVLSANKIISLANQSQNSKRKCPVKEVNDKSVCEPVSCKDKSNESEVGFCVQMNTCSAPQLSEAKRDEQFQNRTETATSETDVNCTQASPSISTAKSNFSLTVLMGDCLTDKRLPQNSKNLETNLNFTSVQNNVLTSEVSESPPSKNVDYVDNSVNNVSFSNISESVIDFNATKESVFESSAQVISDDSASEVNSQTEKVSTLNSKTLVSNNQRFSNNAEALNNLAVTVNSSAEVTNFNNLPTSNSHINTACNINTNILPKHGSETGEFSTKTNDLPEKVTNIVQNNQNPSNMCSDIANSVSHTFKESVPYSANESSINHSLLPSLFSNNQIVNINSPMLVCHTGSENANSIIIPQGLQVSNESANSNLNSCLLHYSHGDFQSFSVMSSPVVSTSTVNDQGKKLHDTGINFSVKSALSNLSGTVENGKTDLSAETDCNKQLINSKKKSKSAYKEGKVILNEKMPNSEISPESNNPTVNKIHTSDAISSFPKSDTSNYSRQEATFNFASDTSDILARATETIFCNDILEGAQITKRSDDCFSDDVSNLNVPVTTAENVDSYKIQYDGVRADHNSSDTSMEKNKKSISENSVQPSDVVNSSHTIQTDVRNSQINSKQVKFCKVRKTKASNDSEPPCKKLKEMASSSEKSTEHSYSTSSQNNKVSDKNISNIHSNMSFLEKQVPSQVQNSADEQNGSNSLGNFNNQNQIHLPDNSCKTPSSVDAMFSLTPMLGDILKDVSHGVALDSRNSNFIIGNENQSVYSSEKNFISFSCPNSSNEDYLNLPRLPFPVIPEISSAPVIHVTSVSFAHSVSLCSTQSDSQKVIEAHTSTTEAQSKSNSKKKDILPHFHNNHSIPNLDGSSGNNVPKQSECIMKANVSESQFNVTLTKASNSLPFENQLSSNHNQNGNSIHSSNLIASQSSSHYNSRENFITPVSHNISFYPTISSSANIQSFPCTTASLPHGSYSNNLSNVATVPVSFSASNNTNNSPINSNFNSSSLALSKPDNLSHSLCSLLKENSNVVGTSEASSQGSSSSSNVAQSKYSALSLISDQTPYSESTSTTSCHSHFVQSSSVHTTSGSEGQYVSTVSSCTRNPKASLSYSAESLLQTSCASTEKSKNNKNDRFQMRTAEKKIDRNSIANMHNINETNIFMPVTSCDINIQNAPLVPLPPVTSFHNFSSAYTMCDSAPSTTIFNTVSRTQDIPLSLSSDNFLNHVNLNVDSQMLSSRHEVSSTVPKPHSNIALQFENPNSLYNNCSFLSHVKPALENSRSSETSACFQPSSYNNNYPQQSQKPNCCQFTHRAASTNSDVSTDINLSAPFHNEKTNFQPNRSGLQASFSQSNSNFMGNFFYNTPTSCHDGSERNDINIKPSTIRTSQEMFVPEGVRQNGHDHSANVIYNSRKTTPSNRSKSKKPKNIIPNENVSGISTCVSNYSSSQDNSCNKVNIYVPNGYFKSSSHPVLAPGQIQCSQNKMSETVPAPVIPANPSFNPVLHQQSDNFLNLNFHNPNFTMSPLPRPPTQPLSCSCLTTPIISHTFSSSTPHPVPNFNLSNILPDMGCSGNQVSFSPAKFPINHSLSSSSAPCQTNSTISNSAHIASHQSCAPSLYPPHPSMVRSSLNPILGHNSQSLIDSQVSLVATAGSVISQNTTFTATQNPTFRNVIHPITFPRNDR